MISSISLISTITVKTTLHILTYNSYCVHQSQAHILPTPLHLFKSLLYIKTYLQTIVNSYQQLNVNTTS